MIDELTAQDKAKLLAVTDGKALRDGDGYDRKFYEALYRIAPLAPEEIDDRVRQAILRFITDGKGEASKPDNGGFVMMGFLHGYMMGRKLRKDIRRK